MNNDSISRITKVDGGNLKQQLNPLLIIQYQEITINGLWMFH